MKLIERHITNSMLDAVAAGVDRPTETIEFVLDCLRWARYDPAATNGHITAEPFCRAFLESLTDLIQHDAEALLNEWRIARSEDLCEIVYALVDAGLATPHDDDSRDDFAGLFDLERQTFHWEPRPTESEQLAREERQSVGMLRGMTFAGTSIALALLIAAAASEPASRYGFILLAGCFLLVPLSLSALISHGYRRTRRRLGDGEG